MPVKLKYTFDDYISNPSGKGSAVTQSVYRDAVSDGYTNKLRLLESERGKIKFSVVKSSTDGKYYIHFKVPSETTKDFYYDVVVEFTPRNKNNTDADISKYCVRFFCNDSSFVFTYAHAFRTHGLLITEFEKLLPYKSLTQKAGTRNPDNTVGYVKNIYFSYLTMKKHNLFDKAVLDRMCKIANHMAISKDIKSYDKREAEKRLMEQKAKNKTDAPNRSKITRSKNMANQPSNTPTTTKTTKKTGKMSGPSKTTKSVKRTKKT